MRSLPSFVRLSALTGAAALCCAAPAFGATVRYDRNEGSYVTDGKVGCLMSVNASGKGSVVCAGPEVYDQLWKGASCDVQLPVGCQSEEKGIRAIGLEERGRTKRASILGVGGWKDTERGDKIVLGGIKGKHLRSGGFSFENRSGHGLVITDTRLRRF